MHCFIRVILLISTLYQTCTTEQIQTPILNSQKTISQPLIGFGTWNLNLSPENTTAAVSFAIQRGYRQIDGAAAYGNEKAVGKGIADGLKKANLRREDIWVTSKLWNDQYVHYGRVIVRLTDVTCSHGDFAAVEAALNNTLDDLGVGYLDLYLMHWPVSIDPTTKNTELEFVQVYNTFPLLSTQLTMKPRPGSRWPHSQKPKC